MGDIGDLVCMGIEKFFYKHPIFRLEELVTWKQRHGSSQRRAVHKLLEHHLGSGRLLRIKRELYAVVTPNATADTMPIDPYLIAGKATSDSILAYHTALELFGVAHSSFEQFCYLSKQKAKPFEFQRQLFHSVALSERLRSGHDADFEVETINRQGIALRVTSLPRTVVDVLDRVELSGGWEEVARSMSNIAVLNIDRVTAYCLKLNNAALSAKVGYFLEQRQGAFAPTEGQLEVLLCRKPSRPQYLSKQPTEPCRLIKKWNIMMPLSVVEKTWEEPEHDV